MSYGSLFEGAFDIFDEELEPSRGRKRTKFGRHSSAWRYTSQSRSPEPEEAQAEEEPVTEAEEPTDKAPVEEPSQERFESPRPPMTDEACQTSEIAPSPPSFPTLHKEASGAPDARESSPALPAVARADEKERSPLYHQDATVDHDQGANIAGIPPETSPDGVDQDHTVRTEHLHTDHGTTETLQGQMLHPPGEPGTGSPFGGFAGQSIPWGSSVPYPTLPPSHESSMDSFMSQQHASIYPDLPQTFPHATQQHHVPEPLPPATGKDEARERPAESQPQQSEAYVVSSDVESARGDTANGAPSAEAEVEEGDGPMRFEDNIKALIPEQRTEDEGEEAVEDTEERPGPELTERVDEDIDVEEAESFPSDSGDEGGDYDTRNYADVQDDDDASDVDEDHEDYGENEEIYDEDENYDQEGEYEEEEEDQEEEEVEPGSDQEEYVGLEGVDEAPAPPASSAPVFIDLISDSEDEDRGEPAGQEDVGEAEEEESWDDAGAYEGKMEEEEDYSGEESEDEARSQGGSEEESGEDEDTQSVAQVSERTSLARQYDGADDIPGHASPTADRDENEGAEDVDMVSKPSLVTVLSSPPPDEGTSPIATQGVEQPVSTEPAESTPATDAEPHKPEAEPEPSGPAGITMTDDAQDHGTQASEPSGPAQVPETEVERLSTEGVAAEAPESASSPDTEAGEPSTREITATTPAPVPLLDTVAAESSMQKVTAQSPEPARSSNTGANEPSTQKPAADDDVDVQMASPAAERSIQQPPESPHGTARESTKEAQEDHEVEASETVAMRESLDDEVQADIDRQMENSLVAAEADERPHDESDGDQSRNEAKVSKGESRPPGAEALASPPVTQATQSQMDAEGAAHEEGTAPGHPGADHPLTPNATQLASTSQSFEGPLVTTGERDDSAQGTGVTLGSPTMGDKRPEVKSPPEKGRQVTPAATDSFTSQVVEEDTTTRTAASGSAQGLAITVRSLRSRWRRSASAEKRDASRSDPSTRLAKDSVAARESSAGRDPSTQLARASAAALRGATADGTPQTPGRTTRSKTRSIQMSSSPEPWLRSPELGDAAEPEHESQSIRKLQLNKNLRLSLLHLTALKMLRSNVNRKVDVLGVATTQPPNPQRPKHGPRDYLLQLMIADQTTAPNSVVSAQVFRPHIESLPHVKEGDVVLLRQFAITAIRGQGFGLRSCEASSWAVWERDREDGLPQIKGPPVEVSEEESSQAGLLQKWYAGLDERAREKLRRANAKMGQG